MSFGLMDTDGQMHLLRIGPQRPYTFEVAYACCLLVP